MDVEMAIFMSIFGGIYANMEQIEGMFYDICFVYKRI